MFGTTSDKTAQLKDEMTERVARGVAQGAEKLAAETNKTAENLRNWSDDLERSHRSRERLFLGLGIAAMVVAIIGYLMTPRGKKHREQLQDLATEMADKLAS